MNSVLPVCWLGEEEWPFAYGADNTPDDDGNRPAMPDVIALLGFDPDEQHAQDFSTSEGVAKELRGRSQVQDGFRESDHPRGQPENAGQFASAAASPPSSTTKVRQRGESGGSRVNRSRWTPEMVEVWDRVMNNPYNRKIPHDQLVEAATQAALSARRRRHPSQGR